MPFDPGYVYKNRSDLFRQLKQHFQKRGVTSERKISELTWRWIRSKGYRAPMTS